MELKELMQWAEDSGTVFTITVSEDMFVMNAQLDRLASKYTFTSMGDLAQAFWSAAYAVRAGAKYHAEHGF